MLNKNLYVSNGVSAKKRGRILEVKEIENSIIFKIEGKKKLYEFNLNEYSIQTTNKTVFLIN